MSDAGSGSDRLEQLYDAIAREAALEVCNGCDQCGNRCVDGFELTRSEFEAVLTCLRELPAEEVSAVLAQPKRREWGEVAWIDVCLFRDEAGGRCLVYPVRPLICRLFGHVEWMPCPIGAVPHHAPDSKHWLWEYTSLERRTMRQWLACHPEATWLHAMVAESERAGGR